MRIAVLGPLEVRGDDGAPVAVPGAKERLLLAVLVAGAPHVVGADRIAETLWDGAPPDSARKSLQAHLVRLRSSLEPDRPKGSTGRYVVRRGAGYALAADRDDVDALRLGDLAARGRAQLVSGQPADAARLLTEALDLWRGEPYADWPQASFAEAERRRLVEVRSAAHSALIEAQLALGRHADVVPELERLVAGEPLREGWWRLLMLALYRAGRQGDALAAGRRARALLAEELGTEPGLGLRQMEAAILAHDPALEHTPRRTPSPVDDRKPSAHLRGSCPYKGLTAYQPGDAALFHGRRRLVATLVARLVDAPVLVVSGPSGAGKSSAVRAGLVPALADGALPGSSGWRAEIVTPGRAPVDALASLTGDTPPAGPVLLVCDQFEELWAPGIAPAERTAFLDAVLGLIDDGIVVRCVAVVRGDHVGRLAEHAAFPERLAGALVLVPALTDDELGEVVREPAAAAGLTADPELVEAVVADVLGRPGALPLLSTALVGTWERRRGDTLTLAGYLEAGGVAGALARSAEDAYRALDEPGRGLAPRLLVRLADVDDGGALVRRPLQLAELDLDGEGGGARRQVVETFVRRRLLSLDGDRLEVAHEALLTEWPRLARWLDDDAAGRAVRRHLVPAVRDWAARGRPDDELYRGARLAAALDWAAGDDADPTPLERQFLDASQERADAELREAHEQVVRERWARRRTRRLALGLSVVLVMALVATLLAVRFQQAADTRATEAERLSLLADANRVAALSGNAASVDDALLLAVQALRLAATPESEDGLLGALVAHRRIVGVATGGEDVRDSTLGGGMLFLDDGRSLSAWSVGSAEQRASAPRRIGAWGGWVVADGSPTEDLLAAAGVDVYGDMWVRLLGPGRARDLLGSGQAGGRPIGISFSADGRRVTVLVADAPGTAGDLWSATEFDVATGARREPGIAGPLAGPADRAVADVSDDGRTAVVFDGGGAWAPAVLASVADGSQVTLQVPRRDAAVTGFRALGTGAAQLWSDGAVTLYGSDGRSVQTVLTEQVPVLDVVLAPDGSWGATAGAGGGISLWAVDPSTGRWDVRESFFGHAGDVQNAEVSSDGRWLVTVGADGRIVVWDGAPGGGFGTPLAAAGDRRLAGRPVVVEQGRLVAAPTLPAGTNAEDGSAVAVSFLDPRTGRVVDEVSVGEIEKYALSGAPSMALSPDASRIAITTGLTTRIVDTGARRLVGPEIRLPPTLEVGSDGLPLPAAVVPCLTWTPEDELLLCNGGSSLVRVAEALVRLDPETGEELGRSEMRAVLDQIAISPGDGTVSVNSLQRGGLWDGQMNFLSPDLLLLDVLTFDRQGVFTDISFSSDGSRLALTGRSGDLYLVEMATRSDSRAKVTSTAAPVQVEWLPDDRTVALGASDGTVLLFDTERGQLRAPAMPVAGDGQPADVHLVPVSSTDLIALTGDRPGRRWSLDPDVWIEQACAVVGGRDLDRADWDRYLPDRPYRPACSDLD
jgi:DNA-binding SARP family transcriptional activator/WD40 repeat protein